MVLNCDAFSTVEIFDCQNEIPPIALEFQDMVVSGDEAAFNAIGAVIIDACNPVIITVSELNNRPQSCSDIFETRREYQVWDQNTFQRCTRVFEVRNPPVRINRHAQNNTTSCVANVDSIFNEWLLIYGGAESLDCNNATASSIPAVPMINYDQPCVNNIIGDIRVLWQFEDNCSEEPAQTIASFFVIDTVPPELICPIIKSFEIGAPDLLDQIAMHFQTASAIDACKGAKIEHNFTEDKILYNCDIEQNIEILFTAVDSCANLSSCSSTIRIINDVKPSISCPDDLSLECGDPNNPALVSQWQELASGEDNLGVPLPVSTNFQDQLLLDPYCNHEAQITFTVEDICGRDSTCTSRIIINDTTAPDISCPFDLDIFTSQDSLEKTVLDWLDEFQAIDDCNTITIEEDFDIANIDFECLPFRTIPVEFKFFDECGNEDLCIRNINITSDYISEISCGSDLTIQCGNPDNINIIQTWIDSVKLTDNVGNEFQVIPDLVITDPLLSSCDIPVLVTFKGEDACGDERECSLFINTEDNEAPSITCPDDKVIVANNIDLETEINNWLDEAVGSDNCSEVRIENSFSPSIFQGCELSVSAEITFTAIDSCALTTECMRTLTVNTDRIPSVECIDDLVLECGDPDNNLLIASWIQDTKGFDYTGVELDVENDYDQTNLNLLQCEDTLVVRFNVIDNCLWTDTCMRQIILVDTTPPTPDCPVSIELKNTDPDLETKINNWLSLASATDNCISAQIVSDYNIDVADLCIQQDPVDVTFTATDDCGLEADCVSTITIETTKPEINCPTSLVLECNEPTNQAQIDLWLADITAFDNFQTALSFTNDFDPINIIGDCQIMNVVTFETEDACGVKSTCEGTIVLSDSQGPIIDCPGDLNLLGGNPNLRILADDYLKDIDITDCNGYNVVSNLDTSLLISSCDDVVTFPIEVMVTDDCNNTSNCAFNIRISNDTTPNITCPDDITVECGDTNNPSMVSDWMDLAFAGDNTGVIFPVEADLDENDPRLNNTCSGQLDVTFRMLDNCNTSLECEASIFINDTTIPEIICPKDTSFIQESPTFNSDISTWLETYSSSDNCGTSSVTYENPTIAVLGNCEPSLELDVIFEVEDECKLVNSCTAIFTIKSEKAPVINCPQSIVLECNDSNNESLVDQWLDSAEAFDETGNTLPIEIDPLNVDIINLTCGEELIVTFLTSDDCGTEETCRSEIKIEDTTSPEINCPVDLTIQSTQENLNLEVETWLNSYSSMDVCSTVDVTFDDLSQIDFCNSSDIIEVVFVAEDGCGLTNECTSVIFLESDRPEISCVNDLVLECGDTSNEILIDEWLVNAVSALDNTGNTIQVDNNYAAINQFSDCETSTTIVTFSTIDACGKTNECQLNIVVDDNLGPDINCPDDTEVNINATNLTSEVNDWIGEATGTDQCNVAKLENDFNTDLNTLDCGSVFNVKFTATDDCGNTSFCNSEIAFRNDLDVEIFCPEPISLNCDDTGLYSSIQSFLSDYEVKSVDSFMVFTDLNEDELDLDCAESYTQLITFSIEDECGNYAECESSISFVPSAKIYIPNMFSPDGDGENDYFTVFGNESVDIVKSMNIYNRWGDLVFEGENFPINDEQMGWDGYRKRGKTQGDVYTYLIIVSDVFGNEFIRKGSFTLIP